MAPSSKKRVAWLSVASNTLLTAGKLAAGLITGSVSILSEAAHSAIDLVASAIATFSVHVAERPPDSDHQYGHEKIENVSGVIEGLLIFGAAGWIIYEAVDKFRHGVELRHLGPGVAVMAVSAVMNMVVATLLRRTGLSERSVALEADAAHLYTDVYTSAGVFAGLVAISAGRRFFDLDLAWLDPVIAIGVALLILHAAYRITRKSFQPLMDVAASPEEMKTIREAMREYEERGVDFHKLRSRRAGGSLYIDLHMGCRPGVTLEQGHAVSHQLKARIEEALPGARVLVHVEPSRRTLVLAPDDERLHCINEELLRDQRVCEIKDLTAQLYGGEIRLEAELCLVPEVTLAESSALVNGLKARLAACVPGITETVLKIRPGGGWQSAIHEDDKAMIRKLVGEHESAFAGIHELKVSSSGGRHQVRIRLGVPRLLPVDDAYAIGRHIEDDIQELFPEGAEIDVHIEPCDKNCKACSAACPEKLRDPRRDSAHS
jgi:cation diffusion facilitator family transporter